MDDILYEDLPEEENWATEGEESVLLPERGEEKMEENQPEGEDVIGAFLREQAAEQVDENEAQSPEKDVQGSSERQDHPLGGMHSQSTEQVDWSLDEFEPIPQEEVKKASELPIDTPQEETQAITDEPAVSGLEDTDAASGEPANLSLEDFMALIPQQGDRYTADEIQPLTLDDHETALAETEHLSPGNHPEEPLGDAETNQNEVFEQPANEIQPEQVEEINENQATLENDATYSIQDVTQVASEAVSPGANPRKVALILSGGGARGAFQVGAEKYAREAKGYHWDIIAGVSVGAMNGAMLAMHRYQRLVALWDSISNNQVYTGGFSLLSLIKIIFGAKSFYGNDPLQRLMQREFEAGKILDDLRVGAVSLASGEYVVFTKESLELSRAILASASIPVVWPPVDVSPEFPAMVDGGVRNITPVGDVLALEPDEIVIINCSKEQPPTAPSATANVLSIGMRTLDIMQNEIFVNDMKEFLRINALVHEAELQGVVLHHPKSGKAFKYYPCQVIEPDIELGETLDFSKASIQAGIKAGVRRAREVLGRP